VYRLATLRAFADGFGSSLLGGLVYCLLLVYCRPGDLIFAWPGVIVLAMTFGGFEMWRIAPRRTPGRRAALVLWAVFASLFVVWAVKAVAIPWWEKGPNVPLKLERVNADAVASVWGERWSGMSWPT